MQNTICKQWGVTNEEYSVLEDQFGKLCEKQAWNLLQKNHRNNHIDDQVDIAQEMRLAMITAAAYYKRQTYIEKCLDLCGKYVKDKFMGHVVEILADLWSKKKQHGANRQKFGPYQEELLDKLIRKLVPKKMRPNKKAPLKLDDKFLTYCKSITWNRTHAMGKKITREKTIRANQVSISEFDFLAKS